ncbi:MAG: lysylphosphatidylglycerol synthase transmembrane domain-containing protein [Candidatus Shapirobacteria bacterium]
MLKKIINSKLLKLLLSAVLIYFAFRKVNIFNIFNELKTVPLKWVIINVLYSIIVLVLGSYRWSVLLFDKINLKKVIDFSKATFSGAFYGLFFPTGIAGDFLKWLPLQKKYPELTKTKLFSSVFLDRFIGFSAFMFAAFVATGLGLLLKFQFPTYLFYLFGIVSLGIVLFYVLVFNFDFEKLLVKFSKYKIVSKLHEVIDLVKNSNVDNIFKCLGISFITELLWVSQVWFVSNIFHAGFTILSVFIFLPIIAIILILPISVAGFGAREQLYLIFFAQVAVSNEKILLVSTFMGILGILTALIGGIVVLLKSFLK